jgi:glycosyltransferase involved in cell wall biosynthesis
VAEPLSSLLTFGIPNFDGMSTLALTLETVDKLGQPDLQVIVVDDGSTDGSGSKRSDERSGQIP